MTKADLNHDSIPEFYTGTLATQNSKDTSPFSDHYSYLFGYDASLDTLFQPKTFAGYTSRLKTFRLVFSGKDFLGLLQFYKQPDKKPDNILAIVNMQGEIIRKTKLNAKTIDDSRFLQDINNEEFFYVRYRDNYIHQFDILLNLVDSILFPDVADGPVFEMDVNLDGSNEYFFQSRSLKSLIITQADLTEPVEVTLPDQFQSIHASLIQKIDAVPVLFVQTKNENYYCQIRFYENPYFPLRYPMYAGNYLVILLIVSLIGRSQRIRIQNRMSQEKKLAELQLQATKKQLDPHFTLNLIDSIGNLYYENDRKTGNYIFGKFAGLLRQTITNSDRLMISLSEEINFVENYLTLEQFKYGGRFDFEINSNGINIERHFVPGMFIHTFVENAIKHGIKQLPGKGYIRINVTSPIEGKIEISISDNGIGREAAKKRNRLSTGKGLVMIDALKKHYNKTQKAKIDYQIIDLYDDKACASGTKVIILIS